MGVRLPGVGGEINMPRRRWWRSWKALTLAGLVATVLIVRLVWGWLVERELQAQLDAIRRRGEPVEVGDVKYPAVPDAENAWVLQMQAAKALTTALPPRDNEFEFRDYPPFPPKWMRLAEASEKAHGQAFALARQARQYSGVQFRQRVLPRWVAGMNSYLGAAGQLGATLADGALYSHLRGDDGEAIDRVLDLLHLARSLEQDDFTRSQFVANGSIAMACNAAQIIGSGLRREGVTATQAATVQAVRRLIEEFLDDDLAIRGLRRSIVLFRLASIDECRTSLSGTWFIQPVAAREIVHNHPNVEILLAAFGCTDWPQACAVLKKCKWEPDAWKVPLSASASAQSLSLSNWRWDDFTDGSSYQVERHFQVLAERRATAVALACQLYRLDHARWPERLEELVPRYLGALPVNPLVSGGRSFGYVILKGKRPGGGDRPLIYLDAVRPEEIADEPMYGPMPDGQAHDGRAGRIYVSEERMNNPALKYRFVRMARYRDLTRFVPSGDRD